MKFATLLLQFVAVSVGALGGLWLKSKDAEPGPVAQQGSSEAAHATGGDSKKAKKEKKSKSSDGGHGKADSEANGDYGYVKFSRQFIVPVITSSAVQSLVVLDVSLEVSSSSTETIYSQEPKIRDLLLTTLLNLSNEQIFSGDFLDQDNIELIRERLLSAAQSFLGDEVNNILILSISRQDL